MLVANVALADAQVEEACGDRAVVHEDDATLTQEERLERLERALAESVESFELCQGGASSGAGGGLSGASQSGADQGGGESGEGAEGEAEGESEGATSDDLQAGQASEEGGEVQEDRAPILTKEGEPQGYHEPNKRPELPSGDSDAILAEQIRRAYEAETDSERKARLWEEYKKYRGQEESQ